MFNKVSSLTLALLLFLVLFGSASNFLVFLLSLGILILATLVINVKRVGWSIAHLLLPTYFLLGVGSVFSVITSPTFRAIFLIVCALVFFMVEIHLGRESHFLQNIYLLSSFAIFAGLFALDFYFNLPVWVMALLFLFFSYLLIVQGFVGITLPAKKHFSAVITLLCAQLAIGLSLWPTYFLVNAIVLFCAFYILWLFAVSIFFGKLTTQKIYWQLALVTLVLILTLSTAAWQPL